MSSPKDKAKELVGKMENTPHCGIEHFPSKHYCDCSEINFFQAKQCALVAVDELWNESDYTDGYYQRSVYWDEVKQEIEKL
jgi:hypothetical protein